VPKLVLPRVPLKKTVQIDVATVELRSVVFLAQQAILSSASVTKQLFQCFGRLLLCIQKVCYCL
jgi:hypothetical protein